jgi:hypothetical protein
MAQVNASMSCFSLFMASWHWLYKNRRIWRVGGWLRDRLLVNKYFPEKQIQRLAASLPFLRTSEHRQEQCFRTLPCFRISADHQAVDEEFEMVDLFPEQRFPSLQYGQMQAFL